MAEYRWMSDVELAGKTALVRVDFNLPMEEGRITDDTRLRAALPTIELIRARGGKAVLLAHFDRPKGKRAPGMSLQPIAPALAALISAPVGFAGDCIGAEAEAAIAAAPSGGVVLLENTRFHAGEEANDVEFARRLAALGDLFVNDAFSAAHRAHASTAGIAQFLPACAGLAMQRELQALARALTAPERPVMGVVGGSKVSTKLKLLNNLVGKLDLLVIGGGMANTFLAANGLPVGKSLHEPAQFETVRKILARAQDRGCEIVLPIDIVWADRFESGAEAHVAELDHCPEYGMILDAGPRSIERIWDIFAGAKTILWNGPLGAFEIEPFDHATEAVAVEAARLTRAGLVRSIAGGGDTVAALNAAGVTDDFTYVSTAGGAFLEWIEGKELPGVSVLKAPQLV
ncbi:MAG TPA: phosphoglycerate kinase [Hyphomonadaceae bacterium]|nr:phosphoglycerate kinase [Hyphomonadaceae bacterium]